MNWMSCRPLSWPVGLNRKFASESVASLSSTGQLFMHVVTNFLQLGCSKQRCSQAEWVGKHSKCLYFLLGLKQTGSWKPWVCQISLLWFTFRTCLEWRVERIEVVKFQVPQCIHSEGAWASWRADVYMNSAWELCQRQKCSLTSPGSGSQLRPV